MNKLKANRGFTLIELLLYLAIASIIVFITAYLLQFTLQSRVKNQTITEVEQQGEQVMQLITQTTRNATVINSPAIGDSSSLLSVDTTIFDLSAGAVRIKEGVLTAINLTSSKMIVSDLNFQNLSRSGTPNTIRVSFTITYINSSGRNEYNFSQKFYGAAGLRK